jgi:hypothetical protein
MPEASTRADVCLGIEEIHPSDDPEKLGNHLDKGASICFDSLRYIAASSNSHIWYHIVWVLLQVWLECVYFWLFVDKNCFKGKGSSCKVLENAPHNVAILTLVVLVDFWC